MSNTEIRKYIGKDIADHRRADRSAVVDALRIADNAKPQHRRMLRRGEAELVIHHRLYDACFLEVFSMKDTVGFFDMNSTVTYE